MIPKKKMREQEKKRKQELLKQMDVCKKSMFELGDLLMYNYPDKAIEALGASKIIETWIEGIELIDAEN